MAPMGGPFGLDMGAVMQMGAALDVEMEMLSEALPGIEAAILAGLDGEGEED